MIADEKRKPVPFITVLLLLLCSLSFYKNGFGQNVGIGTTAPLYPLHIISGNTIPVTIDGGFNMYIRILENGIYRGYVGSFAGAASDIDFGTGGGNPAGSVHLTIQGSPKFTVDPAGNVGIGTTAPSQKLTIASGNILLASSDKGIILNAADRPLITRGWDVFASGANAGVGRWGIFMEGSRLTFGVPNVTDKLFEFAAYETNSTRNTLLTINTNGKVQRPASAGSDLLPVAYANISWGGYVLSGTGNITIDIIESGNVYDIGVTGKTLAQDNTVFFLTITNDGQGSVQNHGFFSNGKLRIVLNRSSPSYKRDFSIMIYQP